jgi:hypothetical protein
MISAYTSQIAACFLFTLIAPLFLIKSRKDQNKIKNIAWSVPFPPDLLARLREFSPLSISRTSGIYLDEVFDILRGERDRTSPELIDKLNETIKKLQKHDAELEQQAAKLAFMIKGLDAIEQQEQKKKALPGETTQPEQRQLKS